ncbi:hypothetical protein DNTS_008995 [Danionella cerebrum]|uniref:Uncharacterized protein n=1 Tax=Danionella cerebrum TaxID=2873325 RepID=A0A553P9A9_9TELE|nr:hypothetical protein DNTS_008995 [Danionella translucida]
MEKKRRMTALQRALESKRAREGSQGCSHDQTLFLRTRDMMGPQLYFSSTYSEEFCYPTRFKPTRARPSSAYRRNNPHPRPGLENIKLNIPTTTAQSGLQTDFKAPEVSSATCALPPAGWILKAQPTSTPAAITQGKSSDTDRIRSAWTKQMETMPSLKPSKHPITSHHRKLSADCRVSVKAPRLINSSQKKIRRVQRLGLFGGACQQHSKTTAHELAHK